MVASDLALEIFGDFFVVWILSPKKTFTQAPKKGLSRAIEGLPQHVLQVRSQRCRAHCQRLQYCGICLDHTGLGHVLC